MMNDPNDKNKRTIEQYNPYSISWWWPILILAISCLLFYVIHLNDHDLPTVISLRESEANPHLFSGERSRSLLRRFTERGPRVAGSYNNEIYATEFIANEIDKIINNKNESQSIVYEHQKGGGSFSLYGSTVDIYENVKNVIAVLKGSNEKNSILLNCHFDSVPTSRGASDDAISCMVMLELLRVLSLAPQRLTHNLIFLFNGAEEVNLLGAHLFISDDATKDLFNTTRLFLNLESAGMGGKVALFQSTPNIAWLFKYYAKVAAYPHTQVVGEELYQNGFIPSDTDLSIFHNLGNLPGLDFAFIRNGYLYHTKYDIVDYIPAGSHQHVGNIVLPLVKELGNAPELFDMERNAGGNMVYADYLGWFIIYYPFQGFIAINIVAALLGALSVALFIGHLLNWSWLPQYRKSIVDPNMPTDPLERDDYNRMKELQKYDEIGDSIGRPSINTDEDVFCDLSSGQALCEFGIAVCARLVAHLATFGIGAAFSSIVDASADMAIPWYSNVWLIFPLYWCPCLAIYGLIPYLVDLWREKHRRMSLSAITQMNLVASQVPWIIIIFVMTCMGIRSSIIFTLSVLSWAVSNIIIHLTPLYKTARLWIWFYLIFNLFAFLYTLYFSLLVYMLFIPIMGRSGNTNGDLYIGLLTVLLCLYISSFAVPLMSLVRKQYRTYIFLIVFSVVMIIISLTTAVGLPYRSGPNNPTPQRQWILHTDRTFHNQDGTVNLQKTGYFIMHYDRNGVRTIPRMSVERESLESDCEKYFDCGIPQYYERMYNPGGRSSWIPGPPTMLPQNTNLKLRKRCDINEALTECTIIFDLEGPDRMSLMFSPYEGASLKDWSINTTINIYDVWNGRPVYYVTLFRAEYVGDYKIELKFNVTRGMVSDNNPILDISLAGNYVHHEEFRSEEYVKFVESFPDWTTITSWISTYKAYII